MRPLTIEDAHVIEIAIQQEIIRSGEARYDHRLHGLLLVCKGYSCNKTADILGQSPRTVVSWVRRFEEHGLAGLQDHERPGRPSSLETDHAERVAGDLRRSPRDLGYEQNLWDGKLLSHHLEKTYQVRIQVRQCQRLFHALGFRRRKPRPLLAHADPELQATYKKTSSIRRPR